MRTHYANGDEVQLQYNGCDGCTPCTVNGTLCHEVECPDAWRDSELACFQCGCDFLPAERYQLTCCGGADDDSAYEWIEEGGEA